MSRVHSVVTEVEANHEIRISETGKDAQAMRSRKLRKQKAKTMSISGDSKATDESTALCIAFVPSPISLTTALLFEYLHVPVVDLPHVLLQRLRR